MSISHHDNFPLMQFNTGCTVCLNGRCDQDMAPVFADNNAVGRRIFQYVPALYDLERGEPGDIAEYVNPNADRGEIGINLRLGLADLENVNRHQIVIDGSGLNRIKFLPSLVNAKCVVTIQNDFPGYDQAALACRLKQHTIPSSISAKSLSPTTAAELVRGLDRPIVYLSMPFTNPGQTFVNLAVSDAILEANPNAYVVIDAAYRRCSPEVEDYVKYALVNPRVLYLNVAAKDLGACGARVSWMIGTPAMLSQIRPDICPYPVTVAAARYLGKLAHRPELVDQIHTTQKSAGDVFRKWLKRKKLLVKQTDAPWILIYVGKNSIELTGRLVSKYGIYVQDQTGKVSGLEGWIRISTNVPCDAQRIVAALDIELETYAN